MNERVVTTTMEVQKAEAALRTAVRERDGLLETRERLAARASDPEVARELGENRDALWSAELAVRDADSVLAAAGAALGEARRAAADAAADAALAEARGIREEFLEASESFDRAADEMASALKRRNAAWSKLNATGAYRGPQLGSRSSLGRIQRALSAADLAWIFDDHVRQDPQNRLAAVDGAALKFILRPATARETAA